MRALIFLGLGALLTGVGVWSRPPRAERIALEDVERLPKGDERARLWWDWNVQFRSAMFRVIGLAFLAMGLAFTASDAF